MNQHLHFLAFLPDRRHVGLILALAGLMSAATLVLGPARLATAQAVVPSWSYTGNLNTARGDHTATLLENGKVLVAGGDYASEGLTAELYDPATGTWSSTGSLSIAGNNRLGVYENTATLLPNGKILVAGSAQPTEDYYDPGSAELYDPATGTWSIAANLNVGRVESTATLLTNGKVLVTGGEDRDYDTLSSAELYDPATETWSSTGYLNTARASHTATLMPDGKVLVAGGVNYDGPGQAFNSAEVYDPATGMWSSTGSLNTARAYDTATLLPSGKVLVAGGFGANHYPSSILNSAELYDPATGTWSSTGNLDTPHAFHTATLLPTGKVLFLSGDSAELYDPATETLSVTASPNTARYGPATLLPNGKVLVASGNTAELYDSFTSCADSISPTGQSFEANGGTASADVTAGNECSWTSVSIFSWISVMSGSSSGNGNVLYSVASNTSTSPRSGTVMIAGRSFTVTQAGAPVTIISASIAGKNLILVGENFDPGAVILLNGEQQITKRDAANLNTALIGKKLGKRVKAGDKLQVQNPNGTISLEFTFSGQ